MNKKLAIGAGVVVLLAVIGAANVHRARGAAVAVESATLERKEPVAHVAGSGRIEAKRSVQVTANVVGKVLEVAVEEGDAVRKGELILRIDPGEKSAILRQAEAEVARWKAEENLAEAELRQVEAELARVEKLVTAELASDQELEIKLTDRAIRAARVEAAREQSRNARAVLDHARRELDKTEVRAEIDGVVVRLAVEEGENVLAGDLYNAGSSIVEIADLSEMEAHVLVDETEVVRVKKGQPALVTVDAFPDRELPGTVTEVGNSAYNAGVLGSQEAKDFRVKILLDSTQVEALRPGLSVSAKIETDRRADALAVPIEALTIRDPVREAERERANTGERAPKSAAPDSTAPAGGARDEVEGVFVMLDGRARFAPVRTGIAGAKDFEVLDGLEAGTRIVRGPFEALRKLESGQKVKPAKKEGGERGGANDERPAESGSP